MVYYLALFMFVFICKTKDDYLLLCLCLINNEKYLPLLNRVMKFLRINLPLHIHMIWKNYANAISFRCHDAGSQFTNSAREHR